jgi:hypothetical protein
MDIEHEVQKDAENCGVFISIFVFLFVKILKLRYNYSFYADPDNLLGHRKQM